ncbi:hypothetical protein [Halobacteriovorax sp. HLS]|uniref:hypothetical protein n=1 Tax=Halobacteriovorax sp. HLS TaxID=2234000 RepID=UPI000FDAC1AE|nr:hypothetical protein [Halobacteriovorax sp. HLS]
MNQKLITILLSFLITFSISAARVATITSPKAVVFSDQNLSTPIGYISYGKKVKVGDVEKKDGTILPVIISGRVAYIQTKDILIKRTADDPGITTPKITEHDVEMTFKTDQDKLSENNFVSIGAGALNGGAGWQDYSESFNDQSSSLLNVSIHMEHRAPQNRLSWGFGISYYTVTQEFLALKTLTLDASLYYALVHFRYITIEGFGGLNFSGDIKISQGQGEQISKGVLYGYNFGALARIMPYSKIGFYAGASIKSLYINDMEPLLNDANQEVNISSLSGMNLFAGLSYKF